MNWGGPEFVLAIIAIATLGGIMKTSIRAKHGLPDPGVDGHARRGRRDRGLAPDVDTLAFLKAENRQLREKLELHENRLISLERIVTDPGYDVARQIEALRDTGTPLPAFTAARDRTSA